MDQYILNIAIELHALHIYSICLLSMHSPPEILIRIITIVLSANIRAVASLAVNKHIYVLVDKLWPEVARRQLKIIPRGMNINNIHQIYHPNAMPLVDFDKKYISLSSGGRVGRILRVEYNHFDKEMAVIISSYMICFKPYETKYVILTCYHRTISRDTNGIGYLYDYDNASPKSLALRAKVKYLMTKVLPELVVLFDFGI